MAKKKKQKKRAEITTITKEELDKLLEQEKKTRTKRNEQLYQEQEKKEEDLAETKQQKFNFEENHVEDEMDMSFTSKRKKKEAITLIEKKVYPKTLLTVFSAILILTISFLGYHFITFDHNKVKTVTKTKKVVTVSPNYLFLGDSITDFYDLEKYFPDEPVVNSGISGNTTEDILNDMEKRVYQYNPSKVFLLIGTNDLLEEDRTDKVIENIKKIAKNIKEKRPLATIYIESIYPVHPEISAVVGSRKNSDIETINTALKKYCQQEKFTYIDVFKSLVDEDGTLNEDYTKDGLHLNDKGYTVVTKTMKSYLS